MRPHRGHILAGIAITILTLLFIACEEKQKQVTKPADVSQAAFVPSANFIASVDLKAIRNTPACKDFAKDNDTAKEITTESGKAQSTTGQLDEIQKITGLSVNDVASVLVSADLNTLDIGGEGGEPDMSKAIGVLAVQLSKPLPNAKLVEAAKAVAAKDNNGTAEAIQVAGQTVVRLSSKDGDDPDLFVASGPGEQTVFMAPNTASLEGVLKRAKNGEFSSVPVELETVRKALPPGAQFKLAFLTPPKLREVVQEQIDKAKKDPDATMLAGMVVPFKDLQSLAVGVECGEDLKVGIGSDLGSPEGASKVATMLETMVLPMATGAIAKWTGKDPQEVSDRFDIKADGKALKVEVQLSQKDIELMQKSNDQEK